jgi:hypothetical protein
MRRREQARRAVRVPAEIALAGRFPLDWQQWASPATLAALEVMDAADPNLGQAVINAQIDAWRARCAALDEWAVAEGISRHEASQLARATAT